MLLDSAFFLCLGLLLAGLIHLFLDRQTLDKLLKKGKRGAVVRAALLGVPLPLCSCSVLPVADQLRKSGVGPGATSAFLISTPETGVDSILLTYSMMDPVMTVARPLAAFVTALTAGMLVVNEKSNPAFSEDVETCGCDSCGCGASDAPPKSGLIAKIITLIDYAVNDLLADLAPYLFIGYLLAGLVAVFLGSGFGGLPETLRTGWTAYLGAIVVGLPLYVCATSSTPLAAVLWAAGFSPGAVLVFLMVGPATNIASLTVVTKILKGRALVAYLGTIVVVSVLAGIGVDFVYRALDLSPHFGGATAGESTGIVSLISAGILSGGILYFTMRSMVRRFSSSKA